MRAISRPDCSGALADWPGHMERAFELARSVLSCAPNPRVGCVLVRDGRRVGEGFHAGAGQAHAEIAALAADPRGGAGATVFVTLEPCSHQGRTGPCSAALIDAGVRQLVVAGLDPNPKVSGVRQLEAAGVPVFHMGDFAGAAEELNRGFVSRMRRGRPHMRCKLAMSLDGGTALANGVSKWITGEQARADAQMLRAGSCAIITGVGTIIADDPSLNVRPEMLPDESREWVEKRLAAVARLRAGTGSTGMGHPSAPAWDTHRPAPATGMAGMGHPSPENETGQPLRVILDSRLRIPPDAGTFSRDGAVKVFSLRETSRKRVLPDHVELITAPAVSERVDLEFMLDCLATRFACNEVLVEAGPTLSGALVKAGLVDEMVIYMAPRLLGSDAKPLLALAGMENLESKPDWLIRDVARIGDDLKITLRPADH